MIILGIDLGRARTGVAVCDKNEILASPVCVLNEKNMKALIVKICGIVAEKNAEEIVLGLPKNMDGSEGESAQFSRKFGEKLEKSAKIPVIMQDERGTTITAAGYLNQADVRGVHRKQAIDAVAATIILQNYIDYRRNQEYKKTMF